MGLYLAAVVYISVCVCALPYGVRGWGPEWLNLFGNSAPTGDSLSCAEEETNTFAVPPGGVCVLHRLEASMSWNISFAAHSNWEEFALTIASMCSAPTKHQQESTHKPSNVCSSCAMRKPSLPNARRCVVPLFLYHLPVPRPRSRRGVCRCMGGS